MEAAYKECDLIRTDTFLNKMKDGAFLEPNGCIADFDLNGYLSLYTSTQVPHYIQRIIAMVLNLPVGKVRVVKPYVGGGFGPKAGTNPMELSACLLSMKTHKPVKMNYSREQVFLFFKHLGLWYQKARPPPKVNSSPMTPEYHIDYTDSQLPVSDNWLYVDPQYPETFTT